MRANRSLFILGGLLVAALLASCSPSSKASAQTGTGILTVRESVTTNCKIATASALNFGTYDPTGTNAHAPLDVTVKALSIACTKGAPGIAIGLGPGMYGSGAHRGMIGDRGGNLVQYDVYTNVDRSTQWNSVNTVSYVAASREATEIPMYGRVPAGQPATAGGYSDTLLALVNF